MTSLHRGARFARSLALGLTGAALALPACTKHQAAPREQPHTVVHDTQPATPAQLDVTVVAPPSGEPVVGAACPGAGQSYARIIGSSLRQCSCDVSENDSLHWACSERGLLNDPHNLTECSTEGEDRPAQRFAGARCECVRDERDALRWACWQMFNVRVGPMPPPDLSA